MLEIVSTTHFWCMFFKWAEQMAIGKVSKFPWGSKLFQKVVCRAGKVRFSVLSVVLYVVFQKVTLQYFNLFLATIKHLYDIIPFIQDPSLIIKKEPQTLPSNSLSLSHDSRQKKRRSLLWFRISRDMFTNFVADPSILRYGVSSTRIILHTRISSMSFSNLVKHRNLDHSLFNMGSNFKCFKLFIMK